MDAHTYTITMVTATTCRLNKDGIQRLEN